MKITDIHCLQLDGILEHRGEVWEERLVRPVDMYPEHRAEETRDVSPYLRKLDDGRYHLSEIFCQVECEEGTAGLSGPIQEAPAFFIEKHLKPLLLGADLRPYERIWDRLYRSVIGFGTRGIPITAISTVDCALWDLRGKLAGVPVYRLLGGPFRTSIPAYASALGYSHDPENVAKRAEQLVQQGYQGMKWFFRHGPGTGKEGMKKNQKLVGTLRDAVGDDVSIMLDCWSSWDFPYTIDMAKRLAPYRPLWIEEPVPADRLESCAALRRAVDIPIATGEHEYTRWGLKRLMDAEAADVLQPDVMWAGGITEMLKICAIASAYDVQIIPHAHCVPPTLHLIASQPENLCPQIEFLINHNKMHQFFFKKPLEPVDGAITLPESPGLGVELDESKIQSQKKLTWN